MKDIIGILDSGVGGISVLKKAVELLPNENFIYYGDNANAPYGPRPIDEIRRLSALAIDHLLAQDIKALVIACNTITAAYASIIRSHTDIPIIGMEPAVKPASMIRSDGKILALATRATLSLDKFSKLMENYGEGVVPIEGVGLVEIVERGEMDSITAAHAIDTLFAPYTNEKIDGVVLGCTHYPFLRRQIERVFPGVPIFDGREGTVRQLARLLEARHALSTRTERGNIEFQTSGSNATLELMKRLFEYDL